MLRDENDSIKTKSDTLKQMKVDLNMVRKENDTLKQDNSILAKKLADLT